MNMYRQGDVLLIQVKALPKDAKEVATKEARVVLAYGEVTGHAHAFYPEVAERPIGILDRIAGKKPANDAKPALLVKEWSADAERYIQALEKTELRHEEHSAIAVEPGVYKVVRQREYDEMAAMRARMVAD